jgi:mono/diheme cytochrome c family protein/plastocyanin
MNVSRFTFHASRLTFHALAQKTMSNSHSETYPSFRSRPERVALALVLLVVVGLPLAIFGYQRLQASGPVRTIELTARLPTASQGGWTPEVITVQKGERVRLRLASTDVVHGFAVPKLGIDAGWVEPGKVKVVEFTADQPGRYAYLCTVWCLDGHWRMRGVIEVIDPDDPTAAYLDVDPPRTDWVASGIDVDADHPGLFAPETPPDAGNGARLWQQLSARPAGEAAGEFDLRLLSPSDLYAALMGTDLPEGPALAELVPAERWDVVAHLWQQSTTPDLLRLGQTLYQRDCTGCHGPTGRGDGPGAVAIQQQNQLGHTPGTESHGSGAAADMTRMDMPVMERPATDFSDLSAQAGASDLLYYGKLVRGGMGTSMPYFGTIYSEDELWAVIAYLRSFALGYSSEQVAQ